MVLVVFVPLRSLHSLRSIHTTTPLFICKSGGFSSFMSLRSMNNTNPPHLLFRQYSVTQAKTAPSLRVPRCRPPPLLPLRFAAGFPASGTLAPLAGGSRSTPQKKNPSAVAPLIFSLLRSGSRLLYLLFMRAFLFLRSTQVFRGLPPCACGAKFNPPQDIIIHVYSVFLFCSVLLCSSNPMYAHPQPIDKGKRQAAELHPAGSPCRVEKRLRHKANTQPRACLFRFLLSIPPPAFGTDV